MNPDLCVSKLTPAEVRDESIGIWGENWWPLKNQPQLLIPDTEDESMPHVGRHITAKL